MHKRRGHHEGGVWYEANQNRWVASVTIGPGKRKRVMCKTKQEAIRVKNELLRKANDGMLPTSEDVKIKEFFPKWLDAIANDVSTFVKYKKLSKYIIADLGELTIKKITPYQIKLFYIKKLADGLSTKTVHSIHGVMHVAFKAALSWGYITRNICDNVEPPK